jgi:hypothetical protein
VEASLGRVQFLFVTLAFSLVLWDAWIYLYYIFPASCLAYRWAAMVELLFALICLGCILGSHILTMTTGPGTTKRCNRRDLIAAHDADECSGTWRWCERGCDLPKPPQCHHCSICNVCVLQMDHHCPWMATCVGFQNLPHFLRYLVWMTIGCLYSCAVYSKHLLYLLHGSHRSEDLVRLLEKQPVICTLAFVCLFVGLAIFGLLLFNVYLVGMGSGTIDQAKAWFDPYDHGDQSKAQKGSRFRLVGNWKDVFDLQESRLWWIIWLVPTRRPRKGQGYERSSSSL